MLMESLPRTVHEYVTTTGKSPFRSWLDALKDVKAQQIIDTRIANMRRGTFGDCKSVGYGVMEMKISYGPGYRIYVGQDGPITVILLCGGDKKSQNKDIKRAHEYWEDYRRRP